MNDYRIFRTTLSRTPSSAVGLFALVLGALSCGDLPRTNPFDPGADIRLALTGPDSIDAVGDTVNFTLSVEPAYAHGPVTWSATWALTPVTGQPGRFIVVRSTTVKNPAIISATVDGRTAKRDVHVVQKPVVMRLSTPKEIEFEAPGDNLSFQALLYDRRGNNLSLSEPPAVTSRDPGVATVTMSLYIHEERTLKVNAYGVGTTHVVVARAGFTDSVRVHVYQLIRRIETNQKCFPNPVTVGVGDTLRLRGTSVGYDKRNVRVADTLAVLAAGARLQWTIGYQQPRPVGIVELSPSGTVVALTPGFAALRGSALQHLGVVAHAFCYVSIQ